MTINDALQIQQDTKNEVRAQSYQGAEGVAPPKLMEPMTPEMAYATMEFVSGVSDLLKWGELL